MRSRRKLGRSEIGDPDQIRLGLAGPLDGDPVHQSVQEERSARKGVLGRPEEGSRHGCFQ